MDAALILGGTVASIAALYGTVRLLEHRTVRTLETMEVRELFELPLPTLYAWFVRTERMRLRYKRRLESGGIASLANDAMKLLTMRIFGILPGRSYRGLRLEQSLARAIVTIDRVIDSDTPPTRGDRRSFFDHTGRLVRGLSTPATLTERTLREDLALVYTARGMEELLGIDPVPSLQLVWRKYTPDALRTLADKPVTDRNTLQQAHEAYAELQYLVGRLLGLDDGEARLFTELEVANGLVHDTLVDLLVDAQHDLLAIPREDLDEAGIDAAKLHEHSTSREDLATVPGVAQWCAAQARHHGKQWQKELLPRLKREVLPSVRPRLARKWLLRSYERREQSFLRCYRWWQKFLPPAVPAGPPSGWLALAEFYEAAAIQFGLPVSEPTMERWRQASATAFWLDELLDNSPDPVRAKEIFEYLVSKPDRPADLPDWPVLPRVIDAVDRLKMLADGLDSYERIVEMALRIGELAPAKRRATSARSYAHLLLIEDALNGMLEAECMSDEERAHPAYKKFHRWCGWFFQTCGLFDALVDLREDYERKLVNVRPTRRSRLILTVYFLLVSGRTIVRHPRAFLALARAIDRRRAAISEPTTPERSDHVENR